VLTKSIGTGTLFAADMRQRAKGRWIDAAIASMTLSSQAAADCLRRHGATACTDVTGFGLLGHLVEMTRASNVDATLSIDAVPLLDGAMETVAAGILSSLQPQNLRLRRAVRDLERAARHPRYPLLFDPQTAGGLLAGVPEAQAATCVTELRALGYPAAAVIGRIEPRSDADTPIAIDVGA
jgi:selenide,water dikinase